MKRLHACNLMPGMVVANEISCSAGIIRLLESGTRLTSTHIEKILRWGVETVAIAEAQLVKNMKHTSVNRSESEFLSIYTETMNDIIDAFRQIKKMEEASIIQMRELAGQKIPLLIETIGVIEHLHKIRQHNECTFRHALNVSIFAGILGRWLGYTGTGLKDIILAGLLHDIGKMSIARAILEKPGPLSADEYEVVKQHSQDGYRLVSTSGLLSSEVLYGILQHHERLDGSGYPSGLSGDSICSAAEIVAIADMYDAMTSNRAYRSKTTPFAAMEAIAEDLLQKKLNPMAAMTFLSGVQERLKGCRVTLNNGKIARIIDFARHFRHIGQPTVYTEEGEILDLHIAKISIEKLG